MNILPTIEIERDSLRQPVGADGRIMQQPYTNHSPSTKIFWFEKDYDPVTITRWMQNTWHICIPLCIVYLCVIVLLKKLMAERQAWSLRQPLIVWNTALALFSITGAFRMSEEAIVLLRDRGIYEAVCYASWPESAFGWWTEAFMWSKVLELGDTIFLLLKKRPLIFLHWYHHVTVLIFTWHACAEHAAPGRWFITMNFYVHSLMYSYYAIRAAGLKVPQLIAAAITLCQTSQMIGGIVVGSLVYYYKSNHLPCGQTWQNFALGLLIYGTYFVLFLNFFVKTYVLGKRKRD